MDPLSEVRLEVGIGLVDDANPRGPRQVTIVSRERWEAISEKLGDAVDPVVRRANLLVSGIELASSCGRTLRIGACRIRANGETRPCELMDGQLDGLRAAMSVDWGGGIYGEVVEGGVIAIGDEVEWTQEP